VQANLSGADVTILATAANSMSAGVIAAKDVKTFQDLRGKKIGIASLAAITISDYASHSKRTASIPTRK